MCTGKVQQIALKTARVGCDESITPREHAGSGRQQQCRLAYAAANHGASCRYGCLKRTLGSGVSSDAARA